MTSKQKYKKYIIWFWTIYSFLIMSIIIMFYGVSVGWLGYMPTFEELENPKSNLASVIYTSDQKVLSTYFYENRIKSDYSELSEYLINSLIATEDIRFREHSGVDGIAILRALYGVVTMDMKGGGSTLSQQLAKMLFHKREINILERIKQKLKEWVIAVKLEKRYTKDEILSMYLNRVDFLNLGVGIKSASHVYFNKEPKDLSLEEAAMLIGMVKNPALFNPLRRLDTTEYRRNVVLKQLEKYAYIQSSEYDSLKQLKTNLNYQKVDHKIGVAPYFREFLRKIMIMKKPERKNYYAYSIFKRDSANWKNNKLYGWIHKKKKPNGESYNLYKDGLRIYTTINFDMQLAAEKAVREHLKKLQKIFFKHWKGKNPWRDKYGREIKGFLKREAKQTPRYRSLRKKYGSNVDSIWIVMNTPIETEVFTWNGDSTVVMSPMDSIAYHKHFLHTGMMSIEPQTGFVKAYVGGINYKFFQYDHVTQGRRQVGSTFKPFVYQLAIQTKQYSPCTKIPNTDVIFDLPEGGTWSPKNAGYDKLEGKMVPLKEALAKSINKVSAYLIKKFSEEAVIKIAQDLGITTDIPAVPSICLGTADISVEEMVAAHATYANKGIWTQPVYVTRIEDKYGNVLEEFFPETREVMDEETAYLMLELMKGVVNHGTSVSLRFRYKIQYPIAGKTGTTQNHSDGWFIGSTPDLVSGVWVGCDDRSIHFRSITYGQGARLALPIWGLYMKQLYNNDKIEISKKDFEKPEKELSVEINCKKYEAQKNNFNQIGF